MLSSIPGTHLLCRNRYEPDTTINNKVTVMFPGRRVKYKPGGLAVFLLLASSWTNQSAVDGRYVSSVA